MSTSKEQIREILLRQAPSQGTDAAAIEGLQLFQANAPVARVPGTYPASLCVLIQGRKLVYLNGEALTYDDGTFLCCTMPIPVEAEIPEASPEEPVLGLLIDLETPAMTETLIAVEATTARDRESEGAEDAPGLVVSPWDEPFGNAVLRLLQLLEDPGALQVLASSRLRELYFALLRTAAGSVIRRTFGASRDLGRALAFLHENIREPINIDALAKEAGMSRAVFHRKFKAATTLSPMQFVKAIRLNSAATLLASGMNAADASYEVGYASPSQFSREFSRHYGMPPRRWAVEALPTASPGA
ncbi:MAG: AraC family transcriptional regulator [Acidobacteriota bacterium]